MTHVYHSITQDLLGSARLVSSSHILPNSLFTPNQTIDVLVWDTISVVKQTTFQLYDSERSSVSVGIAK